ncbi:toxin glutamine deamidase domain-containing protein [Spirilliplanes yamanashiensis]|nr:toxin glutamine deamidase domain-containing protein [Spirilliplanes yamanashiensis]MDP9814910.1 hypothetical protein [Spirilliplanes yamanashiensis]
MIFKRLIAQLSKKAIKQGMKEAAERAAKQLGTSAGRRALARNALREGLDEAREEVYTQTAIQAYQTSNGRRDGLDIADIGTSAWAGFAGGAASAGAGIGGGKGLGRDIGGEVLGEVGGNLAVGKLPGLEDVAKGASSGAVSGAVGGAQSDLNALRDSMRGVDSLSAPPGVTESGAPGSHPASAPDASSPSSPTSPSSSPAASSPASSSSPGSSVSPSGSPSPSAEPSPSPSPSPSAAPSPSPSADSSPSADRGTAPSAAPAPSSEPSAPPSASPASSSSPAEGAPQPSAATRGSDSVNLSSTAPPVEAPAAGSTAGSAAGSGPSPAGSPAAGGTPAAPAPGPMSGGPAGPPTAAPAATPATTPATVPSATPATTSTPASTPTPASTAPTSLSSSSQTTTPAASPTTSAPATTAPTTSSPTTTSSPSATPPTATPTTTSPSATSAAGPTTAAAGPVTASPSAPSVTSPAGGVGGTSPVGTVPVGASSAGVSLDSPGPGHSSGGPGARTPSGVDPDGSPPPVGDGSRGFRPDRDDAGERRYFADAAKRRARELDRGIKAEVRRLRTDARYHGEQARQFRKAEKLAERQGDRRAANWYRDAAARSKGLSDQLADRAKKIRKGDVAIPVMEVRGQDWHRLNTDVGELAPGGLTTPRDSAVPGNVSDPSDWQRPYDRPGGLRMPLAEHQLDVERAVPRGANGRPVRGVDPRGSRYFGLINDGGPGADPTRGINCVDCSLSFFETWFHGRPRVSAPRTFDQYHDGDVNTQRNGEQGGVQRVETVANAVHVALTPPIGLGHPPADQNTINRGLTNLYTALQNGGPGSYAFVFCRFGNGGGHAFSAINQDGRILFVDSQVGTIADPLAVDRDEPIKSLYGHRGVPDPANTTELSAVVLNANGNEQFIPDNCGIHPESKHYRPPTAQQPPPFTTPPVPSVVPPAPVPQQPAVVDPTPNPAPAEPDAVAPVAPDAVAPAPVQPDPAVPAPTRPEAPPPTRPDPQPMQPEPDLEPPASPAETPVDRLAVLDPTPTPTTAPTDPDLDILRVLNPDPTPTPDAPPADPRPDIHAALNPDGPPPTTPPTERPDIHAALNPNGPRPATPPAERPDIHSALNPDPSPTPDATPADPRPDIHAALNPDGPRPATPPTERPDINAALNPEGLALESLVGPRPDATPVAVPPDADPYQQTTPPPTTARTTATDPYADADARAEYLRAARDRRHRHEDDRREDRAGFFEEKVRRQRAHLAELRARAEAARNVGDSFKADRLDRAADELRAELEEYEDEAIRLRRGRIETPVEVDAEAWRHLNTDVGTLVDPAGGTPVEASRAYDQPGGLRRPLAVHQADVERAVPRNPDGTVRRHADPRDGDWFGLLNDGGPTADRTRGINCGDAVLSFVSTYLHANPLVAAPRTFDVYDNGDPDRPRGAERGVLDRIERTTGGRLQGLCPDMRTADPAQAQLAVDLAYQNLHNHLLNTGPGATAIIVTETADGDSHAWTAVNQDGRVLWLDPQRGTVSAHGPLYFHSGQGPAAGTTDTNVVVMDALVLDGSGRYAPLPHHSSGSFGTAEPEGTAEPSGSPDPDRVVEPRRAAADEGSPGGPPPADASAHERELLDALSPDERRELERAVTAARRVADEVLGDLDAIASQQRDSTGAPVARLVDTEHRVKEPASLARKFVTEGTIDEQPMDAFLESVNDRVRFSVETSHASYGSVVTEVLADLRARGYAIDSVKNFWKVGNRFSGVNVTARTPDGFTFEIQFPTEASRALGKRTHAAYETFRLDSLPSEQRVAALLEIHRQTTEAGLHRTLPAGLDTLPSAKDKTFARWTDSEPTVWQNYLAVLRRDGRTFADVVAELGMTPADFPGGERLGLGDDSGLRLSRHIVETGRAPADEPDRVSDPPGPASPSGRVEPAAPGLGVRPGRSGDGPDGRRLRRPDSAGGPADSGAHGDGGPGNGPAGRDDAGADLPGGSPVGQGVGATPQLNAEDGETNAPGEHVETENGFRTINVRPGQTPGALGPAFALGAHYLDVFEYDHEVRQAEALGEAYDVRGLDAAHDRNDGSGNPDVLVRVDPADLGSFADLKRLDPSEPPTAKDPDYSRRVEKRLRAPFAQDPRITVAVVDGRDVGLTHDGAVRGIRRALGFWRQQGRNPQPDHRMIVMTADGSWITWRGDTGAIDVGS